MLFPHKEIQSSTPFRGNPLRSIGTLARGVRQSFKLIEEFSPDLMIGFGSFHSFPLLSAARLKKVPYLLVETNAYPGKVNRLFSGGALLNAIQFEEAKTNLRGISLPVKMPFWSQPLETETLSKKEALSYFGLEEGVFTLLVFGGSQGAETINKAAIALEVNFPFQVIHFSGKVTSLMEEYDKRGIACCVKPFESQMHYAFRAADLAICRSGAGTLAELIGYTIPSVLIPWPKAADNHQKINADILAARGGAYILEEKDIDKLSSFVIRAKEQEEEMRQSLLKLSESMERESLSSIVQKKLEIL